MLQQPVEPKQQHSSVPELQRLSVPELQCSSVPELQLSPVPEQQQPSVPVLQQPVSFPGIAGLQSCFPATSPRFCSPFIVLLLRSPTSSLWICTPATRFSCPTSRGVQPLIPASCPTSRGVSPSMLAFREVLHACSASGPSS